jgi:hypothetical protein
MWAEKGTEFVTNTWKDLMETAICYNRKLWDTNLTNEYIIIIYLQSGIKKTTVCNIREVM